ncbi:SH3 domain-containing protein [Streptomyces sp. NPDC127051]|uniref:SH3 domain-containing protein n=1 Tax=Streptomyces sp. NPDC127051 TaxID=3347119 RepID=UPI00364C4411
MPWGWGCCSKGRRRPRPRNRPLHTQYRAPPRRPLQPPPTRPPRPLGTRTCRARWVSRVSLYVRARPTTSAKVLGSLDPFEKVQLSCQAKGHSVEGNNIWYRLHGEPGWVSARFVHNHTPVRWC